MHLASRAAASEGPDWAGAEVLKNTRFQMKDLFDKEGVPPLTSTKNGRLRRRDNCELTPLARHNRTVLKGPHRQGLALKVWGECVHGLARARARVLASVEAHVHARGLVGGIAKATACDRNRPLHKARTISITWLRRRVGFFLSFFLAGFFLVGIFFVEVFFFRQTRRVHQISQWLPCKTYPHTHRGRLTQHECEALTKHASETDFRSETDFGSGVVSSHPINSGANLHSISPMSHIKNSIALAIDELKCLGFR